MAEFDLISKLSKQEYTALMRYARVILDSGLLQSLLRDRQGQIIFEKLVNDARPVVEKITGEIISVPNGITGRNALNYLKGAIDKWFNANNITFDELLSIMISERHTSNTMTWYGEMVERSTPLTEDEIEESRRTGKPVRTPDVIRASGKDGNGNSGTVFLTPFKFRVTYGEWGNQIISLIGGEVISPPNLFDLMSVISSELSFQQLYSLDSGGFESIDFEIDVLNYYKARKDYWLGDLAGSSEIRDDWQMPYSLGKAYLDSILRKVNTIEQVLKELAKEPSLSDPKQIEKMKTLINDLGGSVGTAIYNSKWTAMSVMVAAIAAHNIVSSSTFVEELTRFGAHGEAITNISNVTHSIYNIISKSFLIFKWAKVFLAPNSIGSTMFGEKSPAATAFEALVLYVLTATRIAGHHGTRGKYIGLAIEGLWFLGKKAAEYFKEQEKKEKRKEAAENGWAPDPYVNYGLRIDMRQFGYLTNVQLHRLFLTGYEESYDKETGLLVRTDKFRGLKYDAQSDIWYYDYKWNYDFLTGERAGYTADVENLAPEGYIGPVSFVPVIEVNTINEGILNHMKQTGRDPKGAKRMVPIPELTPDDIPDLFNPWNFADFDWLSAADEAVKSGNLSKQAVDTVKKLNTFVDNAMMPIDTEEGTTINVDTLDEQTIQNMLETSIQSQFEDFMLPLIDEIDSKGMSTNSNLHDGTPVKASNRKIESVNVSQTSNTKHDQATRRLVKNRPKTIKSRKITPKHQDSRVKSPIPPPTKRKTGTPVTQAERNRRRSRALGSREDLNIESVIGTKIQPKNAPKLRRTEQPGRGGTGTATTGAGGTSTTGGAGGVISPTCFPSYVKVLTPTGEIAISEISIGNSVICFDEIGNLTTSSVTHKFIHTNDEQSDVFRYTLSNGAFLDITDNHSVLIGENIFRQIGELNIGDSIVDLNGEYITITHKEYLTKTTVYNIEVDVHHTYIANGVRVHNALKDRPKVDTTLTQSGAGDRFGASGGVVITDQGGTGAGTGTGTGKPPNPVTGIVDPFTCFPSWVTISTPNGIVKIKDIKLGDKVYAFDTNGDIVETEVSHYKSHTDGEKTEVFRYSLSNSIILDTTENHGVLNTQNEFVEIGSLGLGERLIAESGEFVQILSKESIGVHDVYNISTNNYGTYFANGIRVSGDYWDTKKQD